MATPLRHMQEVGISLLPGCQPEEVRRLDLFSTGPGFVSLANQFNPDSLAVRDAFAPLYYANNPSERHVVEKPTPGTRIPVAPRFPETTDHVPSVRTVEEDAAEAAAMRAALSKDPLVVAARGVISAVQHLTNGARQLLSPASQS